MCERFKIDDDGLVVDMSDSLIYVDNEDCCEKLNELAEEIKELEHRIETLKEVLKSEPFARADGDTTTVQTDEFIQICQENNELKHRIRELEHDV